MIKILSAKFLRYLEKKKEEELLNRWGGIQTCPWCRQIAQSQEGWGFKVFDKDPFLSVLTCGVCKGTSLWKWEHGMYFIGTLNPPVPIMTNDPRYDFVNFRLKSGELQ